MTEHKKHDLPPDIDAAIETLVKAANDEGLASYFESVSRPNQHTKQRSNAQAHLARLIKEALDAKG